MIIGILGGGQLGRMLALAGYPMGMRFRIFDPAGDCCAGQVAPHVRATYDDESALRRFAAGLDVVTFEFENVPVRAAATVSRAASVKPAQAVLEVAQDRLREKELFQAFRLDTAPFAPADTLECAIAAANYLGFPCLLKTRRMGYDGKGQATIRAATDTVAAWRQLGGVPCIVEGFVSFTRELSLLAVRDSDGNTTFYPWIENEHRNGILRISRSPVKPGDPYEASVARDRVESAMRELEYVGILAVEFFEVDGKLVANELAPRVHNSGHWTIDGSVTSQFENHLRAISGLPLGATAARGHAGMVNVIGSPPALGDLLRDPRVRAHLYGKESRPGRKVGHVTVVADSPANRDTALADIVAIIDRPTREPTV